MSAIHELREDYRRYRFYHPQYRLLFWLLDVLMFLVKLALFGGFLFLCWYIMSRNPASASRPVAAVSVPAIAVEEVVAPALTDERIALLKSIAERSVPESADAVESSVELLGSFSQAPSSNNSDVVDSSNLSTSDFVTAASSEVPVPTVVQVESIAPAVTYGEAVPQDSVVPDYPVLAAYNEVEASNDVEGRDWVLVQTPDYYTVQLALTVNRPFLVEFAKKLPAEYTAAIYPERVNSKGGIQYSLSVGNFQDKAGAEQLLAGLSTYNRRFGAHLRTFGEIQQNVTGFDASFVK